MKIPPPARLHAVREDNENPELAGYAGNATISASLTTSTNQPTHKENTMSYVAITEARPERTSIPGIAASNSQERLISVLDRMGLVPRDLGEALKRLAAAGGKPGDHFKVSVWKLDQVLGNTDASIANRIAFKSSLDRAGLLSVER
jgi:hypothetical protein